MAPKYVLVTGPALEKQAERALIDGQIEIVYAGHDVEAETLASLAAAHQVHGIIARQGFIGADILSASPRLEVVSRHGAGVDRVDLDTATALGIPVLRAAGANAISVAEHTISVTLMMVKNLVNLDRSMRQGKWLKAGYLGRDIAGLELGLIGYGAVGQRVAQMARALGMIVRVHDPRAVLPSGVQGEADLATLLAESDVVSLHCPLTDTTKNMISAQTIAQMRKGAFLVNTARGGLVDEAALHQALVDGQLGGAALDCFDVEPPTPDNPLWQLENVVLSPHVAGASRSGAKATARLCVTNLLDAFAGKSLPRSVLANPQILERASRIGSQFS